MIRKGIRNFCNGTSTLNQEKPLQEEEDSDYYEDFFMSSSSSSNKKKKKPPTLEEMILQLEMEEEIAARKSIRNPNNNNDILTSARNQYPRFSLDGKDALYRSSFRNFDHPAPARHSVCCDGRERLLNYTPKNSDVKVGMPARLAGESVVWCNPGVIGKLMGLDAMPIPINNTKETLLSSIRISTSFHRHHNKLDHRSNLVYAGPIRRTPLFSSNMNRNCTNTRYSLN